VRKPRGGSSWGNQGFPQLGTVRFEAVVGRVLTAAVPATVVAALAWSSGGYFARTWGAVLLVEAIAVASVAILATRVEVGRAELLVVGGLLALALWQLVTRAWAVDPDATVLEAERTLLYAGAAASAFLAVSTERAADLVVGVLVGAGISSAGGLLEYVLAAGAPADRLDSPVGYANAAGILATTALVLGLGLAAEGPRGRRALGAALCPPAAATLYLSLSRGSVLVGVVGIAVLCLATRSGSALGRMLLAAVPTAGGAVLAAWVGQFDAPDVSAAELASLLALAGLSAAGAALSVTTPRVPTVGVSPRKAIVAAGAVAIVVAAALLYAGVRDVREHSTPPAEQQGASGRLLSTSTSFRSDYWRVAGRMVEDAPLLGEGAGGFTRTWLQDRPALLFVRDAHNLYLETLAELGPIGLVVLLLVLATPLVGAWRSTAAAAARAALAAYVALLVHAVIDWDWELPAVTLCTVFLGVALVRSRDRHVSRPLAASGRTGLAAGAAVLGVLAVIAHAGNGAAAEANDALDRGDAAAARRAADRARQFEPWAAEPWQLLGEAELAAGELEAGRRHLRRATSEDPGSWGAWLALAQATTGPERAHALGRARALNPLAPELDAIEQSVQNP
jgi:O-Antigen ligase/Tetratricopeptide repeat